MDDPDITQRDGTLGRSIEVFTFGDFPDEIEMSALDEARGFFGPDTRLEVARSYRVRSVTRPGPFAEQAGDSKYQAFVIVREVPQP